MVQQRARLKAISLRVQISEIHFELALSVLSRKHRGKSGKSILYVGTELRGGGGYQPTLFEPIFMKTQKMTL